MTLKPLAAKGRGLVSRRPRPFWQEVAMGLLGCTFFLWPFFIVALAQPHDTLGQALSDGALVLLIAMWLACLLGLIIGRFKT